MKRLRSDHKYAERMKSLADHILCGLTLFIVWWWWWWWWGGCYCFHALSATSKYISQANLVFNNDDFNCFIGHPSLCYRHDGDGICEDFERKTSIKDCGFYTPEGFEDQWAVNVTVNPRDRDETCPENVTLGPPPLDLVTQLPYTLIAIPNPNLSHLTIRHSRITHNTACLPCKIFITLFVFIFSQVL